jgi:hypothetical protein
MCQLGVSSVSRSMIGVVRDRVREVYWHQKDHEGKR